MQQDQARELVGQRILVAKQRSYGSMADVDELNILEVSPSGEWLKTMNMDGRRRWHQTTALNCIEVLEQRDPRPKVKP